ncbi:MAG TPA: hypothetical protein VIK01_07925 [Polyangiaceae bacterium]
MANKLSVWFCGLSIALACLPGCPPKPAVVAAPPPAAPPPPPPPPAPPKCEALSENCTASEGTKLGIGEQGATIEPPSGWKFAKQSDRSVAVGPEGKSVLAAVEIPSGTEPAVLESLEKLTLATGIEKVKFDALKKRFKKPQITVDANGTPVDLWEVSKSTSNGANPELRETGIGTLLVFVAHLAPDRVIIGLGFVVVPEAEADAEKVMHAVQTLKGKP